MSAQTIDFKPSQKEFYLSKQCMKLRLACSTEEFRQQVREAYVKYLVETMCVKSKHTFSAIYWLFNFLKKVKLFHAKKTLFNVSAKTFENLEHTSSSPQFVSTSSASIFEFKLFYYYYTNDLDIPLIPFAYEVQRAFHSNSFAHVLDLLGIVRTDYAFPFIPKDWLCKSRKDLNECLNLLEKCLCI